MCAGAEAAERSCVLVKVLDEVIDSVPLNTCRDALNSTQSPSSFWGRDGVKSELQKCEFPRGKQVVTLLAFPQNQQTEAVFASSVGRDVSMCVARSSLLV